MLREPNTIQRNPRRDCVLKQRGGYGNKDALFSAAVLSKLNCPHSLKSFPSRMWVDSRFHFRARFMKGATTPCITMSLFPLLLWRHSVLSGGHLDSESAELCWTSLKTDRMAAAWRRTMTAMGVWRGLECLCQDDLWSQISHYQSVKPGLIWGLLITVRQFGEVSINASAIAFYNYCRDIRERTKVIKSVCNRVLSSSRYYTLWYMYAPH